MTDTAPLTPDERALLEAVKRTMERHWDKLTAMAWADAGGPNECAHGVAAGMPCGECFVEYEKAVPPEVVKGLLDEIARLRGEVERLGARVENTKPYVRRAQDAEAALMEDDELVSAEAGRADRAEAERDRYHDLMDKRADERDALATIAAAQERALKGDGDGSTVL